MKDKENKKKEKHLKEEKERSVEEMKYFNELVHLKADFENYRKRTEKEKPALIEFGKSQVYLKFLSLYDVVLHAKEHICKSLDDKENCSVKLSEMHSGLKMIFEEFNKVFKAEGIEIIECLNKDYDPMKHEVLTVIEGDEDTDGKVVRELQKGFICKDSVLRSAKVCIAKKPQEETKEEVKKEETEDKEENKN